MKRELTVDDLVIAGIALAVGLLAAFLLRMLLRWLGRHADRTRWSGDDVIVDALRTVVPWSAFTGGVAAAAAALPLTRTVGHNVNQTLTVLLIAVATLTTARVVSTLVRAVTQSRSGGRRIGDDLRQHHQGRHPGPGFPGRAADAGHLHSADAHRPGSRRSGRRARPPGHPRQPLRGHPHPRLEDRPARRLHQAEQRRGGIRRRHQLASDDGPRSSPTTWSSSRTGSSPGRT